MRVPSTSTGVAITNPLVLYRSLLATKRIDADPAQHRLAIRLGQLYDELIDYEPIVQYGHKLNQISRALGTTPGTKTAEDDAQTRGTRSRGILSSLWQRNGEQQDSMALTRVLTNHEAAMQIQSPRGLMLHGEVGRTGLFTIFIRRDFQLTCIYRQKHANRPLRRLPTEPEETTISLHNLHAGDNGEIRTSAAESAHNSTSEHGPGRRLFIALAGTGAHLYLPYTFP